MKTQNRIKTLFLLVVICGLITALSITFFFIKREQDITEAYNINRLRAYTSTIVNEVNESFPTIAEHTLENHLEALEISALVSDTSNNILFNNTSFTPVIVINELYQDHSYSTINEGMIKVSFPLKSGENVIGFIIFEIPKDVVYSTNYVLFYIVIIIEVLVWGALITSLTMNYKKHILYPLDKLNNALLDVSNGVYNSLNATNGVSISSFTAYNLMLENIENRLQNQADYAKSRKQLIANISHEIRTPLSYVKMSAEMLEKDTNISVENKKYIETILSKITTIDTIIEDLFRYSKQDLDKLLVEPIETYAKEMFARIFQNIKAKDETKNITITIHNNIPNILINADENRLRQVVSNMVDNAEKHIMKDGIITITTEIEDNHVVLMIEDSGLGIEPKDLPYIFEPFYQGTQDEKIKKKGAGLGLAICDYIVKKHDGEIFVYSKINTGSKFVVKLEEIH